MNNFGVTASVSEEVSGRFQDSLKIEPFFAEYTDSGFQVESIPLIKTEPASPVSDDAAEDGPKIEIVYVDCVKGEIDIEEDDVTEEEMYRLVKKENEISLCSRNDTNELVVTSLTSDCNEKHQTAANVDDSTRTHSSSLLQQQNKQSIGLGSSSGPSFVFCRDKNSWCVICEKIFSTKSELIKHIRIHTGEKPFTCNVCGRSFSVKSNLSQHMRTHTGEKPFTCNVCENSFSKSSHLSIHMRIHTGEKPFICSFCKKSFLTKSELSKHVRTHTGEKPFTCIICKKSFSTQSYLTIHMRTHTGEKPFTCNFCKKSFSTKAYLTIHMRIHTGEKPFTCNACENSFTYKSSLSLHMRIHKK